MKEREGYRPSSTPNVDGAQVPEHSNVISMQEYLVRHPRRAPRSVGRYALRHTTQMYHQQPAQLYELFPPILVGDTPDETA